MAVNAVSSVYGVSKAGPSATEGIAAVPSRSQEERVRASRIDPSAASPADSRSQRQFDLQQQALVQGVLAAFGPAVVVPVDGVSEPATDATAPAARVPPADDDPNPQLDQAILKFVHALFNVLREFDTVGTYDIAESVVSGPSTGFGSVESSPLAGQMSALAQRYATSAPPQAAGDAPGAGEGGTAADGEALPSDLASLGLGAAGAEPDAQLASAYAEVMAALQGDVAGASEAVQQSSRAELSALLQRLSQAMQVAPVFGGGLPTRGTLLSARA
jgi:hypothetical protein